MTQMTRTLTGFLVAPGVPAGLLYIFNRFMGYGDGSIVGPLLLAPLGYIAAVVFGVPAYFIMRRKNISSLFAYLIFGGVLGLIFYLLFTIATSYPGQLMAVFQNSFGAMLMGGGYATVAAAVFWVIAIRRRTQS